MKQLMESSLYSFQIWPINIVTNFSVIKISENPHTDRSFFLIMDIYIYIYIYIYTSMDIYRQTYLHHLTIHIYIYIYTFIYMKSNTIHKFEEPLQIQPLWEELNPLFYILLKTHITVLEKEN
jgi:hypothetical protein